MTTFEPNSTRFLKQRRYGAIYADPPWAFRNWSVKGTGRNAISHYDCLDFSALTALPVSKLAADDCALFLWVTDPLLPRALELIRAWGFEYKTVGFYWVKLNTTAKHDADYFTGLGYWTRAHKGVGVGDRPPKLTRGQVGSTFLTYSTASSNESKVSLRTAGRLGTLR